MIGGVRDLTRRVVAALRSRRGESGGLLRGTALMTAAEFGNRASRVVTGIALYRALTTVEVGMMMLILTTYELVRIFIHNGLGALVMQAGDDNLDETCRAVDRLNWTVGVIMCVVQLLVAWPTQVFFGADVATMLIVLSVVHLVYPLGMTRFCVAQRKERYGFIAGMQFFQITADNIATAAMAIAGFGIWAVVIPKIAVAAGWVAITRTNVAAHRRVPVSRARLSQLIAYGRVVFASESLNTLRANADNLIVSKVLGLHAFGVYTFACNNGSGIATSLASALGQAVQPYLSRGRSDTDLAARFKASVTAMSLVIMPIIALQVCLAPWYVPLIYGAKWSSAVPAVMLMCLGTLSRPLIVATSQLLRASGAVALEWRISQINAILFVVAIIGGLPFGVEGVAACLSAVSVLPSIIFARLALARVSGKGESAPAGALAEIGA